VSAIKHPQLRSMPSAEEAISSAASPNSLSVCAANWTTSGLDTSSWNQAVVIFIVKQSRVVQDEIDTVKVNIYTHISFSSVAVLPVVSICSELNIASLR
jgi:hypothetical protein